MSTTTDSPRATDLGPSAPMRLFSAITDYGHGHIAAEHYPTAQARLASLTERAEAFLPSHGCIPDNVLVDERRLAGLLSSFLMPAVVSLTESELDGVNYRPILR